MRRKKILNKNIFEKQKIITKILSLNYLKKEHYAKNLLYKQTFNILTRAIKVLVLGLIYTGSFTILTYIRKYSGTSTDFELYSKLFGDLTYSIKIIIACFIGIGLLFFKERYFKRIFSAGILIIPCYLGYEFTNTFQFFKEIPVYEFLFEKRIPYIKWTSPLYMSANIFCFLAVFIISGRYFKKTLLGLGILCLFQLLFWIFFPTQCLLRPTWEVLKETDPFFYYLRDCTGFNAFPSQHVSMTVFLACMMQKDKKSVIKVCLWAILISLSVLTAKQHYVLDLFAGAIVGFSIYLIINKTKVVNIFIAIPRLIMSKYKSMSPKSR